MTTHKHRLAGMCGNLLEHYDNALFGFLAPFIAPLFFEKSDRISALILTYAMLPLGMLTRPLGALFFGWIGDRRGRKAALKGTLVGMGIATVAMGCLPTFSEVGVAAPILLALGRMLQNFFVGGETTGGALFILENTQKKSRPLMSALCFVSTDCGILIASGLVMLLSMGRIEESWRVLFWIGGIPALIGMYLRMRSEEEWTEAPRWSLRETIRENRGALASIAIATGFTYMTYVLSFPFMNGFAPLVAKVTTEEMMKVNTSLLVLDLMLLPLFGLLAVKWGKEKMMAGAALGTALVGIPLFFLLKGASFAQVICIRLVLMVLGIAFAASYFAWAMEGLAPRHRYTVMALGGAIGAQWIGYPTAAVCLWLYQKTGWSWTSGIYPLCLGLCASAALIAMKKRKVHA